METKEIIERVASGLRKMDYKPDYLLFIDAYENVYFDLPSICNIKIIRCGYMSTSSAMDTNECPFLPCYDSISEKHIYNSSQFLRGYDDF